MDKAHALRKTPSSRKLVRRLRKLLVPGRETPAKDLCSFEGRMTKLEKAGGLFLAHETRRWLHVNRSERMDALDRSGIFPPDRQAFHRARYEFALSHTANAEVADIACGLGYGCRILKAGGAKTVLGIDACLEAIGYAQSTHPLEGVRFEVADAVKTPLSAASLDVITCFETIEHIPNTTGLLTEFTRILRPRGTLIISSPNDWGLTEHHCHTWTPFEFMAEIAAFFEIESLWAQSSGSAIEQDSGRSRGIRPWNDKTENQAECLLIVARNPSI